MGTEMKLSLTFRCIHTYRHSPCH